MFNFSKICKKFLILLIFLVTQCAKVDPVTGEKIIIDPDPKKKAEAFRDKGGGIFGDIMKKSESTTFEFASSNVLWRATLKSLEFLPLINADYTGGIIIYDWYSDDNKPSEQIKISVQFLSNELRSDSIKITAHKKQCDNSNKCTNLILDKKFSDSIKEKIILTAR